MKYKISRTPHTILTMATYTPLNDSVIVKNKKNIYMTFEFSDGKQVEIHLNKMFPNWCRVSNQYLVDTESREIATVKFPIRQTLYAKNGRVYKPASQFDLDKYHSLIYPKSDNGKLYQYLMQIHHTL